MYCVMISSLRSPVAISPGLETAWFRNPEPQVQIHGRVKLCYDSLCGFTIRAECLTLFTIYVIDIKNYSKPQNSLTIDRVVIETSNLDDAGMRHEDPENQVHLALVGPCLSRLLSLFHGGYL